MAGQLVEVETKEVIEGEVEAKTTSKEYPHAQPLLFRGLATSLEFCHDGPWAELEDDSLYLMPLYLDLRECLNFWGVVLRQSSSLNVYHRVGSAQASAQNGLRKDDPIPQMLSKVENVENDDLHLDHPIPSQLRPSYTFSRNESEGVAAMADSRRDEETAFDK